jgi:putative transposase
LVEVHEISVRQACKAVKLPRSTYSYQAKPNKDIEVIQELERLVEEHPAIGFWKSYYRLRRQGKDWNHKRVYRVYTQMKQT